MSLRVKLAITFAVVVALVGIQAAAAIAILEQVDDQTALLVRPALARVDTLAHTEADILRLRSLEYSAIWNLGPDTRDPAAETIAQLRLDIPRRLSSYAAEPLDDSRGSAVRTIQDLYPGYQNELDDVLSQVQNRDVASALEEYQAFQPSFDRLDDRIHALRHQEYTATEALQLQIMGLTAAARWPLALVVVLVAAIELWLGWRLSRSISRSLDLLRHAAWNIDRECFNDPIPLPPEPELRGLAVTLNAVASDLASNQKERERLEAERLRLMRERVSQVVRAQEDERARISRELHDQAGQGLTALGYGLARVRARCSDMELAGEIEHLSRMAAETSRQIGALARDLRPSVLDDLGLAPAIRGHVHQFTERVGIPVTVSILGAIPRLSAETETVVFRVVQEALTNVAKHSHAHSVQVKLVAKDGRMTVSIRDDGRGFVVDRAEAHLRGNGLSGLGLAGMHERVELVGGDVSITSAPGEGTQVLVTLPYQPQARQPAVALLAAAS